MAIDKANIERQDDGKYHLTLHEASADGTTHGGSTHIFDSFQEANKFLMDRELKDSDTPERAASEMDPEDAEEINSNVRAPFTPGSSEGGASLPAEDPSSDKGSGNREAPHQTKTTANDDDGKTD